MEAKWHFKGATDMSYLRHLRQFVVLGATSISSLKGFSEVGDLSFSLALLAHDSVMCLLLLN